MVCTQILKRLPSNNRVVPHLSQSFSIEILLNIGDFSDIGAPIGRALSIIHVRYLAKLG